MRVLSAAKAEFARRGCQTQTVRIVTQPFVEVVKGLSDTEALSFPRSLDELPTAQLWDFGGLRRTSFLEASISAPTAIDHGFRDPV